jgi:hypothetical protein
MRGTVSARETQIKAMPGEALPELPTIEPIMADGANRLRKCRSRACWPLGMIGYRSGCAGPKQPCATTSKLAAGLKGDAPP